MLSPHIANHVRYRSEDHGGVVILDIAAGEWIVLNRTAGELWRSWAAGTEFDEAISQVAAEYPGVPEESVRADARQLLRELVDRRFIETESGRESATARRSTAAAAPEPHHSLADQAGTSAGRSVGAAMAAPRDARQGPGRGWFRILIALIFLVAADLMLRCSFQRAVALVRLSRTWWCRSALPAGRAVRAVDAVRRAARWYPMRAACLERSLAVVLLAMAARRRLDWCLGSIPDPYRFHAWVAADGAPVLAADDDPALDQYDLVLSI
jgi:hypothetical protein